MMLFMPGWESSIHLLSGCEPRIDIGCESAASSARLQFAWDYCKISKYSGLTLDSDFNGIQRSLL